MKYMPVEECTVKFIDRWGKTVGSGFFVLPDGHILTCYHVIKDAKNAANLKLEFRETEYRIELVSASSRPEQDIAVVKVVVKPNEDRLFPFVELGSSKLEEEIQIFGYRAGFADGYRLTGKLREGQSIHVGYVYNLESFMPSGSSIQGISGGPAFNHTKNIALGIVYGEEKEGASVTYIHPIEKAYQAWPELRGLNKSPQSTLKGKWINCTPEAGYVHVLCPDTINPEILFAGMSYGGVFRSRDGGKTWGEISEGLPAGKKVNALVVSPVSGKLYAGTTGGLFVSENQGRSWLPHHLLEWASAYVRTITLSPKSGTVLLCGQGKPFSGGMVSSASAATMGSDNQISIGIGTPESLLISFDDEESTQSVPIEYVNASVISPHNPAVIYAATSDKGLYLSENEGYDWREDKNFPQKGANLCLAISPMDENIILVGKSRGMYATNDGGKQWKKIETIGDTQVPSILFSKHTPGLVIAATKKGVYESEDGGVTWIEKNEGITNQWIMHICETAESILCAGSSGHGIYQKPGGAKYWTAHKKGFKGDISVCSLAAVDENNLFLGTKLGIYRSQNGGNSWEHVENFDFSAVWSLVALDYSETKKSNSGRGLLISRDEEKSVQDSVEPYLGNLYAGTNEGEIYRGKRGGSHWEIMIRHGNRMIYPILSAMWDSRILYAASFGAGIIRSLDQGKTWTAINEGLDNLNVSALMVSRQKKGKLFAGLIGRLYKSSDGGDSWQRIEPDVSDKPIPVIVESNWEKNRMFVATQGAGMYCSRDGGNTWEPVNEGLECLDVISFMESQENPHYLYAGTKKGLYQSANGGVSWQMTNFAGFFNQHINLIEQTPGERKSILVGTPYQLYKMNL